MFQRSRSCILAASDKAIGQRGQERVGRGGAAPRRAGAQILACLQSLMSLDRTQHAPPCASLSILLGSRFKPHAKTAVVSRWSMAETSRSPPAPGRKRRGPPASRLSPSPPAALASCLPPPSGRATISGAEARSRHGCAFEGVGRGSFQPVASSK